MRQGWQGHVNAPAPWLAACATALAAAEPWPEAMACASAPAGRRGAQQRQRLVHQPAVADRMRAAQNPEHPELGSTGGVGRAASSNPGGQGRLQLQTHRRRRWSHQRRRRPG